MKKKIWKIIFLVFIFSGVLIKPKLGLAQSCQNDDNLCPQGCTFENDNDCPRKISLSASVTTAPRGDYIKYAFPFQMPSQFNFLGLEGSVSLSSVEAQTFYQSLISILNVPSGNCPPPGTRWTTYTEMFQQYPTAHSISSFILKSKGRAQGKVTVPTNFIFPVKVPLTGCLFVLLDGGEIMEGKLITMESNMSLIYDTEAPPTPAPYFINFGYEFCYRQEGCYLWTEYPVAKNAFAQVVKINSPLYLWSLSGDVSTGAFSKPWVSPPDGNWTTNIDYYLYQSCPPPPVGISGPSDYYRQIPADAENLFSFQFQGRDEDCFNQANTKVFAPKLILPGNCFVNLTRSISEEGTGGISNESQIFALVQPAPPLFTIQGYKLGCPEGTTLMLDGTQEATGNPYFFHNVPIGSHTVSLKLPEGNSAYDLSYSPCNCCINHPDASFINVGSHNFTKDATCNYYDLYWQCKKKGDLNSDGQVNTQDLAILLQNWKSSPANPAADLNSDGVVNGMDFEKLRTLF